MSGGMKLKNRKINKHLLQENKNKILSAIIILIGLLSLVLMVYTYIPKTVNHKQIMLNEPALTSMGLEGYQANNPPTVDMTYPHTVFAGDVDKINASLLTNGIKFKNSQQIVTVFLLELDGTKFGPDGDIVVPMKDPFPAIANWDFSALRDGKLDGKIWIHFQYQDAQDHTQSMLILSSPIEIESVAFWGVSIVVIRLGSIFVFFAAVIYIIVISIKHRYKKQNPG